MNNKDLKPIALILAGYNKINYKLQRKKNKEIMEAYDGEQIYMGKNKFLYDLSGKPAIQYVIDSVYNAKKNGQRLYDKIYLYNDIEMFSKVIDKKKYDNLIIKQMKDSVGGHLKDINSELEYGQKIDIFFGDTPRITTDDVEWIHDEFDKLLITQNNHKGIPINIIFSLVKYTDLKDDWMTHRIKRIKRGKNKGKLKSFIGFTDCQVRVGNSGAFIKSKAIDKLIDKEAVNFFYNIRKALTPSSISKIMYYLVKGKYTHLIKQVKRRKINELEMVDASIAVISKLFKINMSDFSGVYFKISNNASHWENDIDGPGDMEIFRQKLSHK
jgi:molybdopterin-guanine dinucleotide biosynthesis protein A